MFTGIVEEMGEIASFDGERLVIRAARVLEDLAVSDSICVNGACLTVIERAERTFAVQVVPETMRRTNLGDLKAGDRLNLERPLRHGGRIGGHFVQGHVDGVAELTRATPDGNSVQVSFKAGPRIMRYVVEKGFVALDGVSLTVVERAEESFGITVIPFTRDHTTFGRRTVGDRVNVEVDITAKYVEQFVKPYLASRVPRTAGGPGSES